MTYDRIMKNIKIQQSIEGNTPDTKLLLDVLPLVKTASEWSALTSVKHHNYGPLSYEAHIFYYPSPLLLRLREYFRVTGDNHA